MNVGAILVIAFIGLGIFWSLWLIMKKDMFSMTLPKLASYFLGVIVTFLVVSWIVTLFLPWWARQLVDGTRSSSDIQALQSVGQQLWSDATRPGASNPSVVVTPVVVQPTVVVVQPPADSTPVAPVPTQAATGQSMTAAGEQVYVVQAKDTLYSISGRFGVTVDQLRVRNGISGDAIQIGQQLIIPAP